MNESEKPYHYVRFRWWSPLVLEEIIEQFRERDYRVEMLQWPEGETDFSLYKDQRKEFRAESDTLTAFISPYRAILSQNKYSPFTQKDVGLRETILKLFPRNRPTPFPWLFSHEPKFEKANQVMQSE